MKKNTPGGNLNIQPTKTLRLRKYGHSNSTKVPARHCIFAAWRLDLEITISAKRQASKRVLRLLLHGLAQHQYSMVEYDPHNFSPTAVVSLPYPSLVGLYSIILTPAPVMAVPADPVLEGVLVNRSPRRSDILAYMSVDKLTARAALPA